MERTINPYVRTETIELNVTSINQNQNFGQLPNLREAEMIESIEAYHAGQVSKSLNGKTVISEAVLKNSFIKLVEIGGTQSTIRTVPLYDINSQDTAKKIEPLMCQAIDWEKTTVYLADTTGLNVNESFLFKVKYVKAKKRAN